MNRTMTSTMTRACALLAGCATPAPTPNPMDPTHRSLLTLDAHLDTPVHFGRAGWDFGARHDPATELAQLDLPRMADGSLDGGFFVIYTEQGPLTADGFAAAMVILPYHGSAYVPASAGCATEGVERTGFAALLLSSARPSAILFAL